MRSFIVLTFLVLGLAYWELSGGAAFVPEPRPGPGPEVQAQAEAVPAASVAPVSAAREVAADAAQASAETPPPEPAAEATAPADPLAPAEALVALDPGLAAEAPLEESPAEPPAEPPAPVAPPEEVPVPGPDLRLVTGDLVNVRAGPGTGFAVLGQVTQGDLAEVIEAGNGWARVRAPDGTEGWIADRFLEADG